MEDNIKPWELFGGTTEPQQNNESDVKPWEFFAEQRKQQSGLSGRELMAIRESFTGDNPLLCIPEENRAAIEAILAADPEGAEEKKKWIALSRYYSMHHPEAAGFIFDNLEAAIEQFEGKPMSVEQAFDSVRNIFEPKQEGFWGNPVAAAATAGGADIWKSMINTEGFVGKRVIQSAQIAAYAGVGLYAAVVRLIGGNAGKAESILESGKETLLGRDYGQEFEDMARADAKEFEAIETWAHKNTNVPDNWATNSDSVADWTANAALSFIEYMPQLAAQTGLMTATGGVSALATVYGINGYYDIKGDLPDLSEREALLYGLGVAGVNSVLEKISLGILEGKLAEEVASRGIKKGLVRALAYVLASQGLEGAEEGLEEFAENVLDIGFGRRGDWKEWTGKEWTDNLFRGIPEAIVLGFASGLPMAAPHLGTLHERYEYNERIRQFLEKRKTELDAKEELTPGEEREYSLLSHALDSNNPEQAEHAAQTAVANAKLRRKQELDAAQKRYNEAESRLNKAQSELDAISDRTGQNAVNRNTAVMKQRAAQTELDEAKAELEAARRDYVKFFPEEETLEERHRREAEAIRTNRDIDRRIPWHLQDTIDRVNETAKQYTAIPIHAVNTFDELPESARRDAEARGLDKSKANAVWSNGEVYVIADKTRPSDVEKRILHEVVGHVGLRRVFGKDFDAFLDDVFARHSKEIEEMGLSALYNTKPDTEKGRRYLADEFLAKMAEQDVKPSWWKELLAQIRAYLRKVAPQLHFSDAEIEAALVRSARAVREKANQTNGTDGSRFALGGEIGAGRMSDSEIKERNRQTAIEMEEAGKDEKTIWLATGWNRGADRKWKFELPDMKVKLNILNTEELNEKQGWYLWDFADGRELFDAYPELKDVIVRIEDLPPLTNGHYDPNSNEIVLNRNGLIESSMTVLKWREEDVASSNAENMPETNAALSAIRKDLANTINDTLVHEVQHAIQEIEGFAKGTNISEARNVNHEADDPVYSFKEQYGEKIDRGFVRLAEISKDDLKLNKEKNKELVDAVFDLIVNAKTDLSLLDDFKSLVERYAPNADEAAKTKFLDIAQSIRIANEYHDRYLKAMSADQTYRRFAGETESRNIQLRARMSDEERRNRPPSFTEDVHRAYQIVRFSLAEDISPEQEKEIRDAYDYAMNGEPAAQLTGNEFQKDGVPLTQKVTKFYQDEYGGKVVHPELGEVKLDLEGVKSSLGHGIGRAKSAAYAAVPQLIEKGKIFERQTNWKGRGYDTVVMAAPLEIGGVPYIGEVVVEKRSNRQGFYLHEVEVKEKLADAFKTSTKGGASPVSRLIISQLIEKVKAQSEKKAEKAANFKRWFKDSKVVDEDGKPLVVYHGTDADFNVFDMGKTRANMDIRGAFFSPWEDDARGYGKNVRAFYLSIQNPATGDQAYKALNMFKGQNNAGVKARDYLIQQGYDGVINENEEYIAFYPEQIKSATENVGTFDPNNPDVRYSLENMSEEDKSDLVKLLKPKWDEAAFVEPSEAKAYLESIGETGIDENEAWSLYQMAGAAIRAENKRARERARDRWIEQNYDMVAKVSEFASSRGLLDFVIRPSFRFKDNDEWPGTFIAKEWRERGKLKPQGKMSDARYLKYKNDRDRALEHADGKASDELAQEIANKYGGDPLDIEEQIISTFRYLKKTDLYQAYSKFNSEQNYRNKQENAIAEEEYAEFKREQIEQTVAGILENGNQITEEWAMANPEVFAELYRTLMNGEEPPKSKRPSRENLEAMNAKLANEDINAVTYKAAKRAAFAEYQKRLTALRQEMNDKNANAARLQRNAAAFAEEHLPEELRGKFIRGIIRLLDYGTSPSKAYPEGKRMAEFYKLQSEMLNAAQSKRTQDSIGHINEMLDAVKMKRNWKGIPVSVIPSEQTRVERIRKIVNMSAASVANAIDYNNERILELEDRSDKDFEDGKTNAETVAEIQELKDDNALLELFGNLEYRKPDSVTKAEEFLESLIRGGKAKFKSLLAEQAGRVLEMRQQAVNEITGGRNVIPRHGTDAKNHTSYMTKNMNLPTLLRLIAARSGLDFDSSVFGKLLRNVEDSTQKEATANRRLQEEFDAELEAECGITGNIQEKLRKKGRFFKDAGKVVEHTGVYKTQYSRLKVIDPFDNPIVQEDRSSSKVHLIPVEDYEYKGETKPGVRSILRTIDNGGSVEFDGVPLDETGIWMLRKQLDDYDAGIDRRLEFFVDEIDKESAEKLKEDSEKDKLAVISRGTNAEEKRVEVPLSQGTALQILLTWEQEDFRPNMKWNGWTEESIEQIKKFLKPETLKLGYWMRDYFAKQRGELDAAAVKRYGAHLPENANYWPGRFSGRGGTIGTGGMRGVGTMSINPSFLIARKFHLNPVDIDVDAFSVFMDGQAQQNHFLAWTDTIRDLREVIGNADVQDAINGYFGTEVTRNLAERIVTIAQNGTQRGFLVSFFNPMMRHFIPAKIAMNIGSIAKQVEGVLAYINRMPTGEFFKYMSRANFGDPDYRAFAEMAVKSDYLKNRMAGGLDRDILYLMQYTRDVAHYSPFGDSLVSATTYLNKRADRWSALHGGFAVYQYTLDQSRKSGLDEKTAQERARRAWMRATDETQQSGYLKDLNYFQQNQGLVRYLTAFMSNPIQVMNLELQTLNEIKYIPDNAEAKRKLARQILVNHIVVPTLMRFTTDMMRYGINLSDWWDEAEFEDYLQAWLLGPFEGLFFFGKVAGVAWDLAEHVFFGRRGKNLYNADVNALPLLGETRQNAMRFRKDVLDGELTEKDIEDGLAFAGDIGMLYGATPLPGAAEAGSAGVVANASGTLLKRILRLFSGDDDKKKSRK